MGDNKHLSVSPSHSLRTSTSQRRPTEAMTHRRFWALALAGVVLAGATPAPLKLTTGTVTFGSSSLETAAPGPWVVAYDPAAVGRMHATLVSTLAPCGSVAGYLPPAAFLVHVRTDAAACLARVAAVPGVAGVAALAADLRKDPVLAAMADTRVLVLKVASGASADALVTDLTPAVSTLCPQCVFEIASETTVSVSALVGCDAACTLDAPAACGCTMPAAVADIVAAHGDVMWVSRYEVSGGAIAPRRATSVLTLFPRRLLACLTPTPAQ